MAMLRDQEKEIAWGVEQGSMLLGLVVAIFLILLVLGIAAPKVAQELRREREVEAMHRGNQYVRAIQLYYRKMGHYPGSLEQLEKTNNIRFLRQRYGDPVTGGAEWAAAGWVGAGAAGAGVGSGYGGSSGSSGSAFGSSSSPGSSGSSAFGSSGSSGSAFGASSGRAFGGGSPG